MDKPTNRAVYDPQLKHPRPRPVPSKPPAAILPVDADLMAKYDVRSARGGRGGQVAAVTSIWQNVAGNPASGPPVALASQVPQQYTAPGGLTPITTKLASQTDRNTPASPLMASSPGVVKSASVPAMMHSTAAVPILSSSASLARPLGGPGVRTRKMTFPASIPESQSDDLLVRRTSQPTQDIAVGQMRLKELIGRYQS
jgi:hypothetical protein